MSALRLVRHASPLEPGVCAGHADVAVADPEPAAQQVLRQLAGSLPRTIVTSPSERCHALALVLGRLLGASVTPDPRLRELHFGQWEGRSWTCIAQHDRKRMDAWMQNWQTAAPPGGESTIALQTRISACLVELAEEPAVLCVTHAGVIRAAWVLAGIDWTAAMGTPVDYLRVYRVPSSLPLEGRPSGTAH